MAASTSLLPLIQAYETYLQEADSAGQVPQLHEFARWLLRRPDAGQPAPAAARLETSDDTPNVRQLDRLAIMIFRITRSMRWSFRRHFAGSRLQSLDEFSLLAGAAYLEAPTKTQLFQHELLETTTGLQMLDRLRRQDLIHETTDPADKRQKRVHLTDIGRTELETAFVQADYIADDVFGMLTPSDLDRLESVLMIVNQRVTEQFPRK